MLEPDATPITTELPVGTVTFLRSDIEGSMGLVRSLGAEYDELNARHAKIVRSAITGNDGHIVRTEGDAFFAVFTAAGAAARAAVDVQRAMVAHDWPDGHEFKVRIGLHAGTAHRAGDDYGGFEVNRAARIAGLGWGGQVILSDAARALVSADLPDDSTIRDLGRHRLKGIIEPERIHQIDAAGLPTEFPPLRSAADSTTHLPKRLTTFIGREAELGALDELLGGTRLLTLTGPGGTGKTTLALEVARRHAGDYQDGAWFVDLQTVRDADGVRSEIAHGLGIFDGAAGSAAERLLDYVAERELLVVIDNFEQVIDSSGIVRELIDASDATRLIVTSRIPLRLSAEQEYAVRPLVVTPADSTGTSEAVRLFIDRARRVRPDLRIGEAELGTIRSTCRLLDGLPLAIELCAARTSAIPVQVIHDRLEARLPLPDAALRDLPERQRTIEATVAWSFDLVDPPLQRLFSSLGVFEGSFDLEQAEEVCGPTEALGIDVFSGLFLLVDHSLLNRVDDAAGGIRFDMLETMRAFTVSRLESSDEAVALRRRHATSYAALAEREGGKHQGEEQGRSLDRLEPDAVNLRAAARFAIDASDVDTSLRLVGSLWRFWLQTGRLAEGRALIHAAFSLPGAESPRPSRIMALDAVAGVEYWSGGMARAESLYEEQLALAEALDDQRGRALAWSNLSPTRLMRGDFDGYRDALTAARRIFEELGDSRGLVLMDEYEAIGVFMVALDDPQESRAELEEVADGLESVAEPRLRKVGLSARALSSALDGDLATTARAFAAALRIDLALREMATAVADLMQVPRMMGASGLMHEAAVVEGALAAAIERLGIQVPLVEAPPMPPTPQAPPPALGPELYDAAIKRGRLMTLDEVADFVESLGESAPTNG